MINIILTFKKNNIHFNCSNNGFTFYKFSLEQTKKKHINIIIQHINTKIIILIKKMNPLIEIKFIVTGYHPHIYKIIRNLSLTNNQINKIFYISKKPFNGCKKKKLRRLL